MDVTLAAEGQLVKAHRLVLSVCSPYFRKMFTQMPANQHAFVFLKDVSHTALKDLIQFMYCGEVNVKQEALPAFISTAEALQIKGLTDSDPPASQSPAKPSTPAPQPSPIPQIPSPRVRHRASTSRSYNIESIDEVEETKQATQIVIQTTAPPQKSQPTIVQQPAQQHYQPQQTASSTVASANVSHKRPAQRNSSTTACIKRTKSTIDPLEAADTTPTAQQITVQTVMTDGKSSEQQNESEFIDLPIELPTKSEPDYTEDAGEAESAEQETTYVEDDSYGDMRYDENYFTENEEAGNTTAPVSGNIGAVAAASTSKAIVKQQFSDSYAEPTDQANNEAQESNVAIYSATSRGRVQLIYGGQPFIFEKNLKLAGGEEKKYWRCNQWWNQRCRSRVFTIKDTVVPLNRYHTHEEIVRRKKRVRKNPQNAMVKKDSSKKAATIDVNAMSMHLKYEEIVADVTEMVVPSDPLCKDETK